MAAPSRIVATNNTHGPNVTRPQHAAITVACYILAMAIISVGSIYLLEGVVMALAVTTVNLFLVVVLVRRIDQSGYERGYQCGYWQGCEDQRAAVRADLRRRISE